MFARLRHSRQHCRVAPERDSPEEVPANHVGVVARTVAARSIFRAANTPKEAAARSVAFDRVAPEALRPCVTLLRRRIDRNEAVAVPVGAAARAGEEKKANGRGERKVGTHE